MITFEQVNTPMVKKKKKENLKNFDGASASLYANESCDEHAFFLSAMIEMTRHANHVFYFWQ